MHRPSAQEFLQGLLDTLDDLPKEFASRFEEILKKDESDRSQALRQLFEDLAGD
jgi:metal-responsive CopG/Arc/MetJ family transcriptional regulator